MAVTLEKELLMNKNNLPSAASDATDSEEEAVTFNDDQKQKFEESENNLSDDATRPRTPGAEEFPDPDIGVTPDDLGEEMRADPWPPIIAARHAGGTDITGGTDKTGRGALANADSPNSPKAGSEETGDIAGASTTHEGAPGQMEQTGGMGTAPNTVGQSDTE